MARSSNPVKHGSRSATQEGDVGMENYLRTLNELNYTGPLTIERDTQEPERQKAEIAMP